MYINNIFILSKLIGLLFLFCVPLLSILFLKTKRNDLARPVMGTIFLVWADISCYASLKNVQWAGEVCNWASEASPTLGCSIEISRDIQCQGPLFNIFGCAIIRHTKFDTHSSFLPLCR